MDNATQDPFTRKAYDFSRRYIDYKMGLAGAIVMGGIVAYINSDHGAIPAITAASKQSVYTFFFGGTIMKICEDLATKIRKDTLAISLAVLIPTALNVGVTYALHKAKGTPEPFHSTIPAMTLTPSACLVWANRKRKQNLESRVIS